MEDKNKKKKNSINRRHCKLVCDKFFFFGERQDEQVAIDGGINAY